MGTLKVGKKADMVIMNQDPCTVELADLDKVLIDQTWMSENIIYTKPSDVEIHRSEHHEASDRLDSRHLPPRRPDHLERQSARRDCGDAARVAGPAILANGEEVEVVRAEADQGLGEVSGGERRERGAGDIQRTRAFLTGQVEFFGEDCGLENEVKAVGTVMADSAQPGVEVGKNIASSSIL